jgi:nitrogen fixation protein FixH
MTIAQETPRREFRVTGRLVLISLLVFFGVTIGVNVLFIKLALSSFSGEVAPRAYVQGLKFNDQISAREIEASLGWRAGLAIERVGAQARVVTRLVDRNGAAISGANVIGRVGRPAVGTSDQRLVFRPTGEPGLYAAPVADVAPGAWDVEITAHADQATFSASRRIIVP